MHLANLHRCAAVANLSRPSLPTNRFAVPCRRGHRDRRKRFGTRARPNRRRVRIPVVHTLARRSHAFSFVLLRRGFICMACFFGSFGSQRFCQLVDVHLGLQDRHLGHHARISLGATRVERSVGEPLWSVASVSRVAAPSSPDLADALASPETHPVHAAPARHRSTPSPASCSEPSGLATSPTLPLSPPLDAIEIADAPGSVDGLGSGVSVRAGVSLLRRPSCRVHSACRPSWTSVSSRSSSMPGSTRSLSVAAWRAKTPRASCLHPCRWTAAPCARRACYARTAFPNGTRRAASTPVARAGYRRRTHQLALPFQARQMAHYPP